MSASLTNSCTVSSARLFDAKEERYEYSPLRNHASIRLLTLLPAAVGTPLRCHIIECQGRSDTTYEALSYTWNDPVFPEAIYVCDTADQKERSVPITENLYNALRRLRATVPRTLWIDALCIDQSNLQEKGHQVAYMGRIYCEASCVIVWLGEDQIYPRTKANLLRGSDTFSNLGPKEYGELATISW